VNPKINEGKPFAGSALRLVALFGGLAFSAVALAADDGRGPGGENIRRKAWTCTPDAEALLAKWREEAKAYRPAAGRTAIYARGQLKYGAERSDFLHAWYERPLHQNTDYKKEDPKSPFLNIPAWRKTVETIKLGKMDGMGVCLSQSSRSYVIDRTKIPGGETSILVELPYGYHDGALDKYIETAEKAFNMPNSYRIDGKVVLTRYPKVRENELDKAEAFRKALDAKFGKDKFIVIYYVGAFDDNLPDGPMTAKALDQAREHLRRVLRKTDGIFMADWSVYWPRRYGAEFERKVVSPLLRAVLAEPEFAGKKYLGMPMCAGHENCYRWCYSLDSTGTAMFTERMETMTEMRPDFILCCEWDEENENTHVRPTVSNGYVHQRLLRHFADKWAGRPFDVFPGDDTSIPNLVLSYRKSLIAGEPIEAEVRNIPDGTFKGKEFRVSLRWRNMKGRIVKSYLATTLSADRLDSAWFVSPASELVAERVLVPELEVVWDGGRYAKKTGFWPLDINAVRSVDFKWVKQALREQAEGVKGSVAIGEKAGDGTFTVCGNVKSGVKLRSIEVLEGPDTVYMYDPAAPSQDGKVTFRLEFQGYGSSTNRVAGRIAVRNATGMELRKVGASNRIFGDAADGWTVKKGTLLDVWPKRLFFTVPENAVATGEIEIDLAPAFEGRIRLADVVAKDAVGIAGPGGSDFVAMRYLVQKSIPPPCGVKGAEFSFRMKPIAGTSVLRLQTVDENDRVWRSEPVSFYAPSGTTKTFHVFERDLEKVSEVTLDANLADEPTYDFGGERGSILSSPAGRAFWGILGGRVPQATGFGTGETSYGNIIALYVRPGMEGWDDSAPTRVAGPDGKTALHFKGCENAALPQQLFPMFAGFEVTFDVKPDMVDGRYALIGAGATAFEVYMKDGIVQANYFDACRYARQQGAIVRAFGPTKPLAVGKWSHVRITFDQHEFCVSVDGVRGEPVKASAYQHNARYTAIGAANHNPLFFRGALANLSFRLR